MRKLFLFAVICSCYGSVDVCCAADMEHATINSIGRFFGVGYSRYGYHSAIDGRFNAITDRHPAHNYASQNLLHPYYAPTYQRPTSVRSMPAQPRYAPPAPVNEPIETVPAVPVKPAGPPPEWLEQYLNEETLVPPKSDRSVIEKDASPSDRNEEEDLLMFSPQPIELNLQPPHEFQNAPQQSEPFPSGYRVASDPRTPASFYRAAQ